MKTCKVCNKEKEYIYLCLNAQGRSVYKDETGAIWHGKTCAPCFAAYVKSKSNKIPLATLPCRHCGYQFKQKAINQFACSESCYSILTNS